MRLLFSRVPVFSESLAFEIVVTVLIRGVDHAAAARPLTTVVAHGFVLGPVRRLERGLRLLGGRFG